MKLKKALEKAKKERNAGIQGIRIQVPQAPADESQKAGPGDDALPLPRPDTQAEKPPDSAADQIPAKPVDWKAPVYSESHRSILDLEKAAKNRCICLFPEADEIEHYKILRTQIQQRTKEKGWNTVMITSAQPGEGKTVTSINLAITMAKEFNQTVLLVDCDLRRQKIHHYLGLKSEHGLISYLIDDRPLNDLITWPNIPNMTLISGGRVMRDSTELLGSPKMKALVREMKSRYDDRYVIFDVPPVLAGADAVAFAPLMDGIVLVVEAGRTANRNVHKALELIPREKILGLVLNRARSPHSGYYKYY